MAVVQRSTPANSGEPVAAPNGLEPRPEAERPTSEQRLHHAPSEVMATNDALEASQAELQALNRALAGRVDELALANSDLRGVIDSARIAIVVLDDALRVRSFTPAVQAVMHVHAADCGRPVTDLALQVGYASLAPDVHRVLRTHETLERQAVHTLSGAQYLIRVLPHRLADERVAGVVITFLDISATVAAELALRASEERFRRMAAAVPALLFIAGPSLAWEYVNPPFYALTGQPDGAALGDGWTAALHAEDLEANRSLWRQAHVTASPLEHEARLRRADGSWRWFLIRAVPQLDPAGRLVRWYGSCTDIDERRRAETRQGVMLAELQHRIKNILAVVRSVLTRTLESSTDLDHFAAHLAGRIGALARTQGVSARTAEGSVMLEDIVFQELAAHGGQDERQVQVEGPPVPLPPKTADSIGLAIHELATNSLKYGALAAHSGRVRVHWYFLPLPREAGERCLRIEWHESGVPLTDLKPNRRGFGRELIEQGLPFELGARTSMEFRPGGLYCSIELCLDQSAKMQARPARS